MASTKKSGQQHHIIIIVELSALDLDVRQISQKVVAGRIPPRVYLTDGNCAEFGLTFAKCLRVAHRCEHGNGRAPHFHHSVGLVYAHQVTDGFRGHRFTQFGDDVAFSAPDKGGDMAPDIPAYQRIHHFRLRTPYRLVIDRSPFLVPWRIHVQPGYGLSRQHRAQHLGF